jgi:deoxycytidylate deaminase
MALGPCAKRRVTAVLIVGDMHFTGSNDCKQAARVCPRKPGEGYESCKVICDQTGHAEDIAIQAALLKVKAATLRGAKMYLFGLKEPCEECSELLASHGIVWEVLHIGRPALNSLTQ